MSKTEIPACLCVGQAQAVDLSRKAFRSLGRYVEGALESHADAAEQAFVEELADERDAMGYAPGRVEFG
jgi:hypothetical protein